MTMIKPFEKELKRYCEQNSLSYDKVISSPKCGNKEFLLIQYVDREKAAKGLRCEEPVEILLSVEIGDNGER